MDQIKKIIELGVLVEPDAVEKMKELSDDDIPVVMSKIENERPLVLSEEIIKQYLKKSKFIILKQTNPKSSLSVQDFVDDINDRYSFLQNIILNKINTAEMVSINKCSGGKASVIGMVKSVKKKDTNYVLEIEDTTGSIQIVVPNDYGKKIDKDDVIAVSGNINNKILFADSIVFPDVPLRQPNKSELSTKVGFIANHNFEKCPEIDTDYLILYNCENIEHVSKDLPFVKLIVIGDTTVKATKITSSCLLDIDGVIIMLAIDNDVLRVIRKRYVVQNNAFFGVEPVPDVVFTEKTLDKTQENYKGISIVQNFNVIDLSNREVTNITNA